MMLADLVKDDAAQMDRFPEWYVLLTEPQREHTANGFLLGRRFRTYLPVVPHWTTRGIRRTKIMVHKPMFRGYLFIHLDLKADEHRLRLVHSTPGIRSFLKIEADNEYAVINDKDMQIVRNEEEKASNPERYASQFAVGERVRVSEGSFSGLNVEICTLGDEERITVLLSLLGRAVRTQLSPLVLEKL